MPFGASSLSCLNVNKTRIVICDDHTLFVEGMKAMLRNESSLEIVGEARGGRQAVDLVKDLKPDVLLMDVSMPDMNGFDATRHVHQFDPALKVLILTMHDGDQYVSSAVEAGAVGDLLKDGHDTLSSLVSTSSLVAERGTNNRRDRHTCRSASLG